MTLTIEHADHRSDARVGSLATAHGAISTPAFMPCASRAVVRGCRPADLVGAGVEMLICNAYHLLQRPGDDLVARMGSLHALMGWTRPLATDSGGFQVFSLGAMATVTEQGAQFRSELDGRLIMLSPELSIAVQNRLGADLIMAFDECAPYPASCTYISESVERTLRWAERCRRAHGRADQALLGIVQGGVYPELRAHSARETAAMGFDGYAVGGLSVGESRAEMLAALDAALPLLPREQMRYAMGVGTPLDIVQCARRGVDLFDCVLPTRNARHGSLLTWQGVIRINSAAYRDDPRPLEEGCDCPACRCHSRAYLHYLFRIGEAAAWTLLSLHNLRFYTRMMERLREAIRAGELDEFEREVPRWTRRDSEG